MRQVFKPYAGPVQEAIRAHIDSCGSKIAAVLFLKKDGTFRKLRFNRKAIGEIAGTERGKEWSAKVTESNPNLVRLSEITRDGLRWRSVNLDTVLTVQANGRVTRYRAFVPIAPRVYELVPLVTVAYGVTEESK
jgi:hypothetical protein